MCRTAAVLAAAGMVPLVLAAPAQAAAPEHGHVLVLGVKYVEGEPVGFRKCVELAGGNRLRLGAHHAHAHTGRAGEALEAAGHFVVPLAPLSPIRDCEHLKELFPA